MSRVTSMLGGVVLVYCCCGVTARAADLDGDGVLDGVDVCCNTPAGVTVDAVGRPIADLDQDCDVDLADFALFAADLTGPLTPVACATCTDTQQNGNETDVDCGGGTCPPCAIGLGCLGGSDCVSLVCQFSTCMTPTCSDGVKNGNETGPDCGGGTCPPCATGFGCALASDCQSQVCQGGTCQAPSCMDGIQNGGETGVDCGGPCAPCTLPNGSACAFDAQCQSGQCVDEVCCNSACNALCQACNLAGWVGTCTLIPNGLDPANECSGAATCDGAGSCTTLLNNGVPCSSSSQCLSGFCVDGVCCNGSCGSLCQACNLTGSVGSCAFIPGGADPANECAGTAVCNGAGVCTP